MKHIALFECVYCGLRHMERLGDPERPAAMLDAHLLLTGDLREDHASEPLPMPKTHDVLYVGDVCVSYAPDLASAVARLVGDWLEGLHKCAGFISEAEFFKQLVRAAASREKTHPEDEPS